MEFEHSPSFLGSITSLCSQLTAGNSGLAGTPAISTPQLKKIRASALKNILFPDGHSNGKLVEADHSSVWPNPENG